MTTRVLAERFNTNAVDNQLSKLKLRHWMIAVGIFAFAIRLFFIVNESRIPVIWDAEGYWLLGLDVRHTFCAVSQLCPPLSGTQLDLGTLIFRVIDRSGLLIIVLGILTAAFPAIPMIVYVFHALLDTLICFMIISTLHRLGLPRWGSILGGILFALYVPAIIGTAAILQQPLLRFGAMLAVWGYTCAFSSAKNRDVRAYILLGGVGTLILGFSSATTRPLMWIVQGAVIILAWTYHQQLKKTQLVFMALTFFILLILCILLVLSTISLSWIYPIFLGLSETAENAANIYSFQHFWAFDRHWNAGSTGLSAGHFLQTDPIEFVSRWVYSIASNWRYPDTVYFQSYMLDIQQQQFTHVPYLVSSLIGFLILSLQRGLRQKTFFLIAAITAYSTVIYSYISVEPRRMVILSPFMAVCTSIFLVHAVQAVRAFNKRPRVTRFMGALIFAFTAWIIITPDAVLSLIPVEPVAVYLGLLMVRSASTFYVGLLIVQTFQRRDDASNPLLAQVILYSTIFILILSGVRDSSWREWSIPIRAGSVVQQTITNFNVSDQTSNWLLLDFIGDPAYIEVLFNGEPIKTQQDPIYRWEVGDPPPWSAYTSVFEMATTAPTRALWYALPVPDELVTANIAIELRVHGDNIWLRGDYFDDPAVYIGPSFDPTHTGLSLWRWQWNTLDPRIPAPQLLNGAYVSSIISSSDEDVSDSAPAFRLQHGLLRMFVVQMPAEQATDLCCLAVEQSQHES